LIVGTYLTEADGHAERDAALPMAYRKRRKSNKPMTLGADKAYDTQDFVAALRDLKITPHVTQNDRNRKSAIDGRTTRHTSYQISQAERYWVEKPFGWMKSVGPLRKVKLRGRDKLVVVVVHLHSGGLQHLANSEVAGGSMLKPPPPGRLGFKNRPRNPTTSPLPR
jgi:hypothetical protein